ncbi:hypothetical protein [Methylobacterium sp. 1973]|uniref:hypothetical protein n=1 Tax=Methylobacterium sp. 1973 TaxID=3156421 RepID=UPI00339A52FC
MSAPESRRGFLRGLTTLPLVGGGVTLIGQPTHAATPITPGLLATYSAWLHYERMKLHWASLEARDSGFIPAQNPGFSFQRRNDGGDMQAWGVDAQLRAPVILAAAGCPLTSATAEGTWRDTFRLAAESGR